MVLLILPKIDSPFVDMMPIQAGNKTVDTYHMAPNFCGLKISWEPQIYEKVKFQDKIFMN